MTAESTAFQPPVFAPEVIQTSAMDCGPAVLKCLLDGAGIRVSYGRLREACQTDLDGTSIDTLEVIARQLGLDVHQTIMPRDHLVTPAAELLPALVVVLQPDGSTHFVVAWRLHGPWVQVMDPGTGRRWSRHQRFLSGVYWHTHPYPAILWRAWAGSKAFTAPLQQRLTRLGLEPSEADTLVDAALQEAGWYPIATLDAATRMTASVVQTGYLERGAATFNLLNHLLHQTLDANPGTQPAIPEAFWSVRPQAAVETPAQPDAASPLDQGVEMIQLQGAVLLRVRGKRAMARATSTTEPDTTPAAEPLPPSLAAVLEEAPPQPIRHLLGLMRPDGLTTPAVAALAVVLAAAGTALEVVLLQRLMLLAPHLWREQRRLDLLGLVLGILGLLLLLDSCLASTLFRMGRRLEAHLRLAFLTKIPRLGDRYFHSRLTSDMAERAYSLRIIHQLPLLGFHGFGLACQLLFTAVGICWLSSALAPLVLVTLGLMFGLGVVAQPALSEVDLRLRTHDSALSRFNLDAFLGLVSLRAHGAEPALRREHESLLTEWARTSWAAIKWQTAAQSLAVLIGTLGTVAIVFTYLQQRGNPHEVLLLLYWAFQLPVQAQLLLQTVQQYPGFRNVVLRLLEPLSAPEEELTLAASTPGDTAPIATPSAEADAPGVTIEMAAVEVVAGGHTILRNIDLHIDDGEHVAIVGASGAGKSSLVGLLLGWYKPAQGHVWVNGQPLEGTHLTAVRGLTAWLDPAVQLWNRSVVDNLSYGVHGPPEMPLADVMEQSALYDLLVGLPDGLQTSLGEGGGLVSGGEGQRVRFGRALMRPGVHLAILDEPFRGLDRRTRRELMVNARRHWQGATVICIMHDVTDTQDFSRVIVLDQGRIVEDAGPEVLAARPKSHYSALLQADAAVQTERWQSSVWRRLWLEDGQVREEQEQSDG